LIYDEKPWVSKMSSDYGWGVSGRKLISFHESGMLNYSLLQIISMNYGVIAY